MKLFVIRLFALLLSFTLVLSVSVGAGLLLIQHGVSKETARHIVVLVGACAGALMPKLYIVLQRRFFHWGHRSVSTKIAAARVMIKHKYPAAEKSL